MVFASRDLYNVSVQYTIRNIPKHVDEALRKKAEAEGKSLNDVTFEALVKGLGLNGEPVIHHDLDHFIGTWVDDPVWEQVRRDHEQIDPEMWK